MSPWDRVASRSVCEMFVFTVVAVHLGLDPEDCYRRPEFSRGYDQALTSVANRLRKHARDILPPFPISELGRKATAP